LPQSCEKLSSFWFQAGLGTSRLLGKITPFTQKLSVGWEFLVAGQFRQNCWALCWATIGILVGILGKIGENQPKVLFY